MSDGGPQSHSTTTADSRRSSPSDGSPRISPALRGNNENDNQLACESAAVGLVYEGTVPEGVGRATIKTERAGHFARLEEVRRQPGNCRRCGKRNGNGYANCDRCRNYHALYRVRRRNERLAVPSEVAKDLAQFRRELSRLRATVKNMANERRNAYRKGYAAGLIGKRARFRSRAYIPPAMSMQELSTINHAYVRAGA